MECDVGSFEADPEGLAIAAGINAHLPPAVRVLAVQRVQQKFDARQCCASRGYRYFLPASALGMRMDGGWMAFFNSSRGGPIAICVLTGPTCPRRLGVLRGFDSTWTKKYILAARGCFVMLCI